MYMYIYIHLGSIYSKCAKWRVMNTFFFLHDFLLSIARTQVQRVMKAIESREEAQLATWKGCSSGMISILHVYIYIYTSNEIGRSLYALFVDICSSVFSRVGRPVEARSLKAVRVISFHPAWGISQAP